MRGVEPESALGHEWFVLLRYAGGFLVDVFFLPLSLLALLFRPILLLESNFRRRYRSEGWRGVSRFRLSHFLVACAIVGAAAGFIGRYYVRRWETQRQAEEFYTTHRALSSKKQEIEDAATALDVHVNWMMPKFPSDFQYTDQIRNLYGLESAAYLYFQRHWRPSNAALGDQQPEQLKTLLTYPALASIQITDTPLDAALFADMPGSDSLLECNVNASWATAEFYEWCSKCPNLKSLGLLEGGRQRVILGDDCLIAVSEYQKLESLYLGDTCITAKGAQALHRLKRLRFLSFELAGPLAPDAMAEIAALPVTFLQLNAAPLSPQAIEELAKANHLELLELGGETVSDDELAYLQAKLPSTRVIFSD